MISLTLVQTEPATNPDTNVCLAGFSGNYVEGTGDQLPLANISDPQQVGQVPIPPSVATNPPPQTPYFRNCWINGYYLQVQRILTAAATPGGPVTTAFFVRVFAPGGAELVSEAYPAALTQGEVFLAIAVDLARQS